MSSRVHMTGVKTTTKPLQTLQIFIQDREPNNPSITRLWWMKAWQDVPEHNQDDPKTRLVGRSLLREEGPNHPRNILGTSIETPKRGEWLKWVIHIITLWFLWTSTFPSKHQKFWLTPALRRCWGEVSCLVAHCPTTALYAADKSVYLTYVLAFYMAYSLAFYPAYILAKF